MFFSFVDMEPTATFTPMKHDQVTPYKNSPDKPGIHAIADLFPRTIIYELDID